MIQRGEQFANSLREILRCGRFDVLAAKPEGDEAEKAERAVDEPPAERNAAHFAHNEGEGNDEHAGDHAELDDPDVFDGITQWADERNGDNEVTEGKPVGAVTDEWIFGISIDQAVAHFDDPGMIDPPGQEAEFGR